MHANQPRGRSMRDTSTSVRARSVTKRVIVLPASSRWAMIRRLPKVYDGKHLEIFSPSIGTQLLERGRERRESVNHGVLAEQDQIPGLRDRDLRHLDLGWHESRPAGSTIATLSPASPLLCHGGATCVSLSVLIERLSHRTDTIS